MQKWTTMFIFVILLFLLLREIMTKEWLNAIVAFMGCGSVIALMIIQEECDDTDETEKTNNTKKH